VASQKGPRTIVARNACCSGSSLTGDVGPLGEGEAKAELGLDVVDKVALREDTESGGVGEERL
jgi:hypothetical protein